jgi:hypothetical protein
MIKGKAQVAGIVIARKEFVAERTIHLLTPLNRINEHPFHFNQTQSNSINVVCACHVAGLDRDGHALATPEQTTFLSRSASDSFLSKKFD